MGKSSAPKQQVAEYRMSVHLGVCLSADAITGIWVNEKEAWTGESAAREDLFINKPDLFGGPKKEGGLQGAIAHLPGKADQTIPDHLAARYGLTEATSPGYRGITSLFFVGGGSVAQGYTQSGILGTSIDPVDLAEQQASNWGFSWSHNNPVIAQNIWVRARRAPGNGPGSQMILDPSLALIGPDANPAHLIADCLTNTIWGMGEPTSDINIANFNAAAQTFFNEAFGLSVYWNRQTEIQTFVTEILDHIQATLFLNPRSGLWELKPLRDDYDISLLRHINPQNARLTNFQRKMWGEVANEVAVSWTNPENEEEETVTAQDLGAVINQGGSPVSTSRTYYAIRNRDLAMRVAQRDVRSASAPLATATAEVTREFGEVVPGEPMVLTWPEKKVFNLIVRAMSVDSGTPESGKMVLPLLEDIFSLERPAEAPPQQPGWVDPSVEPEPIDAVEVITLPAYFTASADLQSAAVDLTYPEVQAAVLGYQESADAWSYSLAAEDVVSNGETAWRTHGLKSIVERTVLPTGMAWAVESRLQESLILNTTRGPRVGSFVFLGAGSDAAMEIAQVVGFDSDTREWVLARGVLDTIPRAWTAGTPAWFVNVGLNLVDEVELRSAGETVEYKLLTRTSKGVLPLADAPVVSETLSARPHLPLRPANVKVNGTASGSFNGGAASTLTVTWATRNRQLEDGQVVRWDAGSVAPEYEQGTVVSVYDQTSALVYQQVGLWTETQLVLQRSWFDRYSAITIEVSSRRRDLDSLQGHRIQVTGLAANPAAPLPPAPAEPGPPPSPEPAPSNGAWTATGVDFVVDDAGTVLSSVPAIVVSGARDRESAVGLLVRYRKDGSDDWFTLGEVPLNDQPAKVSTSTVNPQTKYWVEVAYRTAANILGEWGSLGFVITGKSVAQEAVKVGDLTADEWMSEFDRIDQAGQSASEDVRQALEAALALSASLVDRVRRVDLRTYLKGQPVGPIVEENLEQTANALTKLDIMAIFDLSGAGSAILNLDKVYTAPGVTFSQHIFEQQSVMDDKIADYNVEILTYIDYDSIIANRTEALGVWSGDNSSVILSSTAVKYSGGQTLAQKLDQMMTRNGGAVATSLSVIETWVDASSAVATNLSLIAARGTGPNSGSMMIQQGTFKWDATRTLGQYIEGVRSQIGSDIASYDSTIKTWVDNNSAAASKIEELEVYFGTDFVSRIAVMSNIASDLGAKWGVSVTTITGGQKAVGGIEVSAGAGGQSSIILLANNFALVDSAANNSSFFPVSYSGGVWRFNALIRAQNIEADVVTGTMIKADTIVAQNIIGGEITHVSWDEQSYGLNLTSSPATVFSLAHTATFASKPHVIHLNCTVANGIGDVGVTFLIKRDGTTVATRHDKFDASFTRTASFMVFDSPSAGAHTYTITAQTTAGSGSNGNLTLANMTVTELKR